MMLAGVLARSRAAFWALAHDAAGLGGGAAVVVVGDDQPLEPRVRLLGRPAEAPRRSGRWPAACLRRAPPPRRRRRGEGYLPAQCAGAEVSPGAPRRVAATTRARSASSKVVARSRGRRAAALAPCMREGDVVNERRASPASRSACSGAPSRSWATSLPSKTPTGTTVSASVSPRSGGGGDDLHGPRKVKDPWHDSLTKERPYRDQDRRLSAARTPNRQDGRSPRSLQATDLGRPRCRAALERAGVEPEQVDHVIMVQSCRPATARSRRARRRSRPDPKEVSSETINKVCASGACARACCSTRRSAPATWRSASAGDGVDVERAVAAVRARGSASRMGDVKALDRDGPRRADEPIHRQADVRGGDRDRLRARDDPRGSRQVGLLRSHERAVTATDEGRLPEEIAPITVKSRKSETVVEIDECAAPRTRRWRRWPSSRAWPRRKARTTAGTRRGSTTAAARLVLAPTRGRRPNGNGGPGRDRRPRADRGRVRLPGAYAGQRGPEGRFERAGLRAEDIDLWEINEAFASVALNSVRVLGIDAEKVNVNGARSRSAHPIGASGARILGSLILELRRRGGGLGCAAICSGGGQGDAVIVRV